MWVIAGALAFGLCACTSNADREPALGTAFVGPVTLQAREELAARAELAATLKHGERVEIIGRRRRFYKIRTGGGAEGWVDGRQLLRPEDMEALEQLAEKAKDAPSQGRAGVYEALNVHTLPNRQAPSFFQITAEAQADVIAHERVPRVQLEAAEFIAPTPVVVRKKSAKKKKEPEVPPPPAGKPPGLPKDWMALSGHADGVVPLPEDEKPEGPAQIPPAPPADDWSLIRSKDGRAGWVLARMLLMAIPDEVAQYAERARIAAYFSLGKVQDRGEDKPVWLWATQSQRGVDFDFDSLRIFTWSTRRHRYETSFVERGLKGYLPVRLYGEPGHGVKGFRVVVEEKTGERVERDYALSGFRARVVKRGPAPAEVVWFAGLPGVKKNGAAPPAPEKGLSDRLRGLAESVAGKVKR